jgi:hypothetical protein
MINALYSLLENNKACRGNLQAILGHADIRTTMRYSHFSKAYLLENANIVRFEAQGNVIKMPIRKTSN